MCRVMAICLHPRRSSGPPCSTLHVQYTPLHSKETHYHNSIMHCIGLSIISEIFVSRGGSWTRQLAAIIVRRRTFMASFVGAINIFEVRGGWRCYGWGATIEYRLKSAILLQRGQADPKFQVEGVAPQLIILLFSFVCIKIWTDLYSVLSQCTRLTDRQTDVRTDRILIARLRGETS